MPATTRFAVLGPLEVRSGGTPVELRAPKHRALLGALLLRPGRSISLDQLVDDVWGSAPPASARHLVQVYVSDLRKILASAGIEDRLETNPGGYRIRTEPGELDAEEFGDLVAAARESLRADDPAGARPLLREALSLWRGDALADAPLENEAAALRDALTELRLTAIELLGDADLAEGEAASLVPELERLVSAHPFRERLRAQLMLALYRSGRQADALATFQDGRTLLADELGLEPSRQLRDLERAILNQDPDLSAPGSASPAERAASHDEPPPDAPARRRGRLAAAAVAITAGVVAVAAVVLLGHRHGPSPVRLRAGEVVAIDPQTGAPTAAVRIGPGVGPVAVANGRLWVGDRTAHTLSLVALSSHEILRVVGLPATPYELAAEGDVGWVTYGYDGTIGRYDARTGTLTRPFHPLAGVRGLVALDVTPRAVWLGLADSAVLALDPVSAQVKRSVRLTGAVQEIAAAPGSVWAGTFPAAELVRLDPVTLRRSGTEPMVASLVDIAADGGSAWALTSERLVHVSTRGGAAAVSVPVGPGAQHVALGAGSVWVSSSGGVLEQIDAATGEVRRTIRLHHEIGGVVYGGGKLWATLG